MERLQKYMASCGIGSRRKCEEYILQGRVRINSQIVKELGVKINPNIDEVMFDNQLINPEKKKVYYMLNKPLKCVTTVKDDRGRKTVVEIINCKERIFPIGRLDYMTSGLLLLTNDGNIYNRIMHPRVRINKTYIASIRGKLSETEKNKFKTGIDIGGYITAPASIEVLSEKNNESLVKVMIHEGKNRQIRRMFEKINHEVLSLKRVQIGTLSLGDLPCGGYRELTKSEINYLNNL